MKLRQITLDDYEEVVNMYYNFMIEVFGNKRQISPKYFYYKQVIDWINSNKHIIVAYNDKEICGFSLCYIDNMNGLTEDIYNAEVCYVKPEYRNTRASYMLYHNGSNMAKDLGLNLYVNGRIDNGVSKMIEKHFNLESTFINYERIK